MNVTLLNKNTEDIDNAPLIMSEKVSIQKSEGTIRLCLAAQNGEPVQPEILYSGGENALFRRNPDQFILLTKVPDEFFSETDVRDAIFNKKELVISEKDKNSSREYNVKILLVFEKLDSIESIIRDGYPLFTSLRARVCAEMDKPISQVIGKEDFINLAAVLAREENYPLLKKYFDEGLPINERVSPNFIEWRPTPLYYISINRLFGFLEDPIKIIRYLAANGADPNMACEEEDTPLGNQCFDNGLSVTIKTLLETGADPNCFTKIASGPIKPLHLLLLPSNYNRESKEFTPINESDIEKVKLLLNAGADVNYVTETGITALSLAINNSEGKVRNEIIKLLREKGADENAALDALKKGAETARFHSAFSLYEIYSGNIENLSVKPDSNLARKYLCIASDLMNKS